MNMNKAQLSAARLHIEPGFAHMHTIVSAYGFYELKLRALCGQVLMAITLDEVLLTVTSLNARPTGTSVTRALSFKRAGGPTSSKPQA